MSSVCRYRHAMAIAALLAGMTTGRRVEASPRPPATADGPAQSVITLTPAEWLSVESTGGGKPVVLVPGLFGGAFGFRRIVPLLVNAGYRAIVVEPLGIGRSARPPQADYSLAAQSDRIAAAIAALGLRDVVVIAHSLGAAEGFRLAYRHPGAVQGLISIEGGPTEEACSPAFRRALRFASWLHVLGGRRLVRHEIRASLISSSGDASWVTDGVVAGYTEPAAADIGAMLRAYLQMATAREPELLAPHLAEIQAPVRMLVGSAAHDGDVTADELALLKRTLPRFAVDVVPGAGHFIQEERPEHILLSLERLQQTLREMSHEPHGGPSSR
jgi:pimeloyl-ACP methyl ester carboxylesterase